MIIEEFYGVISYPLFVVPGEAFNWLKLCAIIHTRIDSCRIFFFLLFRHISIGAWNADVVVTSVLRLHSVLSSVGPLGKPPFFVVPVRVVAKFMKIIVSLYELGHLFLDLFCSFLLGLDGSDDSASQAWVGHVVLVFAVGGINPVVSHGEASVLEKDGGALIGELWGVDEFVAE
mgnify:CR=1 FL=1